ncbi:hypothetical protein BT63DRAFT_429553 [Microthyrium microscopicum]|uniref:Transcription factor domain-containing protein n=1 Tax=Microthyrium microscopicum TaxID=703497 RepID=A0A6A6TYS5_9PEZI|nr:hypothetical protein BT63DRAFT_429553 [Microthyrium microscopicum]
MDEVSPAEEEQPEANSEGFQFISFNDPKNMSSSSSLSLIRRHAMKQIGKSRRRPRAHRKLELVLDAQKMQTHASPHIPKSWWLGAGPMDPFVKYPIDLGSKERELVTLIFNKEIRSQLALRDAWFSVGLSDTATFLLVLANSALVMDSVRHGGRDPEESADALQYQTRAIRYTNSKLGGLIVVPTDEMIGNVTGLMCYNVILGKYDAWVMHRNGLISMVQLVGGVERIALNVQLRLTISWVEIQGAFALDLECAFPLPAQWEQYSHPIADHQETLLPLKLCEAWTVKWPRSQDWLDVYRDLFLFSRQTFFDTLGGIQSPHSGGWTNAIMQRLLAMRPLRNNSSPGSNAEEACRVASLIYLAPIWRKFGVFPVRSIVLVSKLRSLLSSHRVDWTGLESLHLWVLYMGYVESSGEDREWFVSELDAWSVRYGLESWDLVQQCVRTILWIDNVFGAPDNLKSP